MCKTKNKEFSQNKYGFAHDIYVAWLNYGDIKIRDTYVYKHILVKGFPECGAREGDGRGSRGIRGMERWGRGGRGGGGGGTKGMESERSEKEGAEERKVANWIRPEIERSKLSLMGRVGKQMGALWVRTTKNTDRNTGPLARPLARTAHSFACSALLASPACSVALTHLLAYFTQSNAHGKVTD